VAHPTTQSILVLGTDGGEITGAVVNDRTEAMTNVIVALVPESPYCGAVGIYIGAQQLITPANSRLRTVPPGTYKIFSWEYVESDAWEDAQFLQPYETVGKIVTVREGSTQDTQVKSDAITTMKFIRILILAIPRPHAIAQQPCPHPCKELLCRREPAIRWVMSKSNYGPLAVWHH
jgi:hypothetical protein